MQEPDRLVVHEGLTELLKLKAQMLRTVWGYILTAVGVGVLVLIVAVLIQGMFGVTLFEFLREEGAEHLRWR